MVVDDLSFMRSVIKDILVSSGMKISCEARDGVEAVSLYSEKKPQLVLLDIAMPRMDGLTCLKKIRRMDPDSTIIMCSSLGDQKNIIKAIQWGARDFVVKPFQKQRLISAVKKAIHDK